MNNSNSFKHLKNLNMKKINFLLLLVLMAFTTKAQWLSPYSTATCGGTATIDTVTITYTIGQAVTMSGTVPGGSLIGGFQQPFYPVTFCGDIVNETRTLGPGLVLICGDINVKSYGILKINPQTTLMFEGAYGINVEGTGQILAEGETYQVYWRYHQSQWFLERYPF